jgi:hypothetical protein
MKVRSVHRVAVDLLGVVIFHRDHDRMLIFDPGATWPAFIFGKSGIVGVSGIDAASAGLESGALRSGAGGSGVR